MPAELDLNPSPPPFRNVVVTLLPPTHLQSPSLTTKMLLLENSSHSPSLPENCHTCRFCRETNLQKKAGLKISQASSRQPLRGATRHSLLLCSERSASLLKICRMDYFVLRSYRMAPCCGVVTQRLWNLHVYTRYQYLLNVNWKLSFPSLIRRFTILAATALAADPQPHSLSPPSRAADNSITRFPLLRPVLHPRA